MQDFSAFLIDVEKIPSNLSKDLSSFWKKNFQIQEEPYLIADKIFMMYWREELVFILACCIGDNVCEIYDVCTDASFRRRGIATKGLLTFLEQKLSRKYWLGIVDFDIIPLYEKIGFSKLGITDESPLGKVFTFNFLAMVLNEQ